MYNVDSVDSSLQTLWADTDVIVDIIDIAKKLVIVGSAAVRNSNNKNGRAEAVIIRRMEICRCKTA